MLFAAPFVTVIQTVSTVSESLKEILNSLLRSTELTAETIFCLFESEYIDENYTDEFNSYYCKLYKMPSKHCWRVHFFYHPTRFMKIPPLRSIDFLFKKSKYLGFIVTRPWCDFGLVDGEFKCTTGEPFENRLVVNALWNPTVINKGTINIPSVVNQAVHIRGYSFYPQGVPFQQQDSRAGACAQSAILVADKIMHSVFHSPRHKVSDITYLGKINSPAGRMIPSPDGEVNGLSIVQMVNAMHAMNLEPLIYFWNNSQSGTSKKKLYEELWRNLFAYVTSGIPVVLVFGQNGSNSLHAVTAIGYTDSIGLNDSDCHYTRSYESIVLHDDQMSPYVVSEGIDIGSNEINYSPRLKFKIESMIIPLPGKIFLTATGATDVVNYYIQHRPRNKKEHVKKILCKDGDKRFHRLRVFSSGKLIENIQKLSKKSKFPNEMRKIIGEIGMPRYVWVNEFYAGTGQANDVYGMMIMDATAEAECSLLFMRILDEVTFGKNETATISPELHSSVFG